jgi:flagellar hook assembly protein FlgD
MRSMRHRLPNFRGLTAAFALLALPALFPSDAGAVQISIHSAFVHDAVMSNTACGTGPPAPLAGGVCCKIVHSGAVRFMCPMTDDDSVTTGTPKPAASGNISNDPQLQFDIAVATGAAGCHTRTGFFTGGNVSRNFCNKEVFLCAAIGYGTGDTTADLAIDTLQFEVFKFQDGSNALDAGSTPPLRTFFVDAPGAIPGNSTTLMTQLCNPDTNTPSSEVCKPVGPFCVLWDGNTNIQGFQGKTNGEFGFRVTVHTNQTGPSGNVQITATRAYPSGATLNELGLPASQRPITVDVTNVHVIRSSPSLAGQLTPVPAQPYNLFYRLSKDATMFLDINGVSDSGTLGRVRTILPGFTRVGEGTPNGSLSNGDSWNGRQDNGDFVTPGNYLARFAATSADQFGVDTAEETLLQIGIDPLQITDIRVAPLLTASTALAVLDYVLTEAATVYVDIYPPSTQFCNFATNLNGMGVVNTGAELTLPGKDFVPRVGGACAGGTFDAGNPGVAAPLLRRIVEQKPARVRTITFWDGRDGNGNFVSDGDYVFVIYAALPSQNGQAFSNAVDRRIWTSIAKSGFLNVTRGLPEISQVTPASTVIGTNPPIAGLQPFIFRYSMARDAFVTVNIRDLNNNLVRRLVNGELRPGQFGNVERWEDGKNDSGRVVSSGTYQVELIAVDPLDSSKSVRTSALFPVSMLRIIDIQTTSLLGGASETLSLSYQLSQPMMVSLNIYPPGTIIRSDRQWPPCGAVPTPTPCPQNLPTEGGIVDGSGNAVMPITTIHGFRAGRLRITEQWDGRDNNGLIVPDGQYVFLIVGQSTAPVVANYSPFPQDKTFGTINVQRGQILFPNFSVQPDVPTLFNSSNTITLHPFTIQYSLTRQSSVTIQVLNTSVPPQLVRTIISGDVRQNNILLTDVWDGRDDNGNFPPSGFYIVRAIANDVAAQLSQPSTAQITISYDPIRIFDVAVSPVRIDSGGSTIFYQVSEPMKVAIKIYRPGTVFDIQGNSNPPEAKSLVKRIVGVKAARVSIEDLWDGTDLRMVPVPDGGYKFKIIGSTDVSAIADITGDVLNASALSLDRPIDEIPVTRGASLDPVLDFEQHTFVFPNPISGNKGTFQIFLPFQARVKLRIYTMAGQLVHEKDFGEQAASYNVSGPVTYVWNKVNQSGRTIARGMYYALVRIEGSLGDRTVLQTTKKILVP